MTEHTRIVSQDNKEREDHDTIIRLDTKVGNICNKLDAMQSKQDYMIEVFERKISWKNFWSVLSVLAIIIASIVGYNFTLDAKQSARLNDIDKQTAVHKNIIDRCLIEKEKTDAVEKGGSR